jgi:hypothetical protein
MVYWWKKCCQFAKQRHMLVAQDTWALKYCHKQFGLLRQRVGLWFGLNSQPTLPPTRLWCAIIAELMAAKSTLLEV